MKRMLIMGVLGVLFLGGGLCRSAHAGVDVNINIAVPPPIALPAPPLLLPIPGVYAYFAPDVDADIIFYRGSWYRPHRGGWYRSNEYNGRWVVVPQKRVPVVLLNLGPNWKRVPPGHRKMPYGQVKSNWKAWERDKHWDKQERKREKRQDRREHREGKGGGKGKGKRD